jgi:hypothetical protein
VDRAGSITDATHHTSLAFLGVRLTHSLGKTSGIATMPLISLIFSAGWICHLMVAHAVMPYAALTS